MLIAPFEEKSQCYGFSSDQKYGPVQCTGLEDGSSLVLTQDNSLHFTFTEVFYRAWRMRITPVRESPLRSLLAYCVACKVWRVRKYRVFHNDGPKVFAFIGTASLGSIRNIDILKLLGILRPLLVPLSV